MNKSEDNTSFNNKVIIASSKGIQSMAFDKVKVNNMTTITLNKVAHGLVVRIAKNQKGKLNKIATKLVGQNIHGAVLFHSTTCDLTPAYLLDKYKNYKHMTWASLVKKISKDESDVMKNKSKVQQAIGTEHTQIIDEFNASVIMNCDDIDDCADARKH